jgi:Uma2 family endonuclease
MTTAITEDLPFFMRRGFTAKEYDRLAQLGFFEDEKLELIEGEIIWKLPHTPRHATGICLAQMALTRVFQEGFMVRVQLPLALGTRSRPEPDIVVVRGTPRSYLNRHPTTAELVVEVSELTLQQDRETKAALYARHNIAEYWIINLVENTVEVRRDPAPQQSALLGHAYLSLRTLRAGESFSPLAAPQAAIAVNDLLP